MVSICVGIMFLLSSCNTTENEVKTNENISAEESVVTCENYDSVLENLSIPYVMSTVHDYLEKDYKKGMFKERIFQAKHWNMMFTTQRTDIL